MSLPGTTPLPPTRCHWHRGDDGTTTLIPGCWPRVYDPDANCLCGEWSEDTARQIIRSMQAAIYRERHNVQTLRAVLRRAGLPDHPDMTDRLEYTARKRRRAMHRAISEAGEKA